MAAFILIRESRLCVECEAGRTPTQPKHKPSLRAPLPSIRLPGCLTEPLSARPPSTTWQPPVLVQRCY